MAPQLLVVPAEAQSPSGANPLLGTWKLKSFVREVTATGEKYNQMGEHPNGYLSYSADGRMHAILTMDNRIKPLDANPTDEQRVKLHQTLQAYSGTYTVQPDKVIHHVDISWNEAWTGTDQVRFFRLPNGECLSIPGRQSQRGARNQGAG